jgi:tyrosinase
MKYSQSLLCLLGALSTTSAAPSNNGQKRQDRCSSPVTRKSWNDATDAEKLAYLDAAVCLTKQPSKLGHAGTSLHDDFAWAHNKLSREIHGVASFLPWHRLFVQTYENALQSECGYTGHAMYWDWVRDSHAPAAATVWDPVTGFGGNGTSPDDSPNSYCVTDGPFSDLQLAWLDSERVPHCLNRYFLQGYPDFGQPEMIGNAYNQEMIDGINLYQTFLDFHGRLESTPHGAVHAGISGDMGPQTSPNGKPSALDIGLSFR